MVDRELRRVGRPPTFAANARVIRCKPTALVNEAYLRLIGSEPAGLAESCPFYGRGRPRKCVRSWWTSRAKSEPPSEDFGQRVTLDAQWPARRIHNSR
jgi:hypothetical protein